MAEEPTQTQKIIYICKNINDLKKNFRKEILQMIIGAQIPECHISEKGGGTQIKVRNIPPELIGTIYNYIKKKTES